MPNENNRKIIDGIFFRLSEKLDKNCYLFNNILAERESLAYVDDSLYYQISGEILKLDFSGFDLSSAPKRRFSFMPDRYEEQRKIILRYLMTLSLHEVKGNHKMANSQCINLLSGEVLDLDRDFVNVLYLIILFDHDDLYKNLCGHLAKYCSELYFEIYIKNS